MSDYNSEKEQVLSVFYNSTLDTEAQEVLDSYRYYISKPSDKNIKYINTPLVLIGDIDVPKCVDTKEAAISSVKKIAAKYKMCIRIYETENGIRFIVMDRLFPLQSKLFKSAALDIMKEAHCDPLYIKYCDKFNRYAARLTPKHQTDFIGIRFIEEVDALEDKYINPAAAHLVKKHDQYLYQFNWFNVTKQCLVVFFDYLFSLR